MSEGELLKLSDFSLYSLKASRRKWRLHNYSCAPRNQYCRNCDKTKPCHSQLCNNSCFSSDCAHEISFCLKNTNVATKANFIFIQNIHRQLYKHRLRKKTINLRLPANILPSKFKPKWPWMGIPITCQLTSSDHDKWMNFFADKLCTVVQERIIYGEQDGSLCRLNPFQNHIKVLKRSCELT